MTELTGLWQAIFGAAAGIFALLAVPQVRTRLSRPETAEYEAPVSGRDLRITMALREMFLQEQKDHADAMREMERGYNALYRELQESKTNDGRLIAAMGDAIRDHTVAAEREFRANREDLARINRLVDELRVLLLEAAREHHLD